MVERRITVRNAAGVHVRPSGIIFEAIRGYDGTILVRRNDRESRITSIMSLIALGLVCGDEAELVVSGPEEAVKAEELAELFEREFDFEPRS